MTAFWAALARRLRGLEAFALMTCLGLGSGSVQAKPDWFRADSANFTIYLAGSADQALRYAQDLERFREASLLLLGVDDGRARTSRRLEILVPARPADLNKAFGAAGGAFYAQCQDGVVAAVSQGELREWRVLNALYFSLAARWLYEYSPTQLSRWYVTGFAKFMSATEVEDGRVTFGGIPLGSGLTLEAGKWLDWDEILASTSPERAVDPQYAAQAWLLTHYMLTNAQNPPKLARYFLSLERGAKPVAAFEAEFGLTPTALHTALKEHRKSLSAFRVQGKSFKTGDIAVTALSPAQSEGVVLGSGLRLCPGPGLGGRLLAEARKLREAQAKPVVELRRALARAELMFGSPDSAEVELAALLAEDPNDFEAQHLMARLVLKLADAAQGDERQELLKAARTYFFNAYKLRKLDAPNLYHMATFLARMGPDPAALSASRNALALEPTETSYALLNAQLELRAGDRERAMKALRVLASSDREAGLATRARAAVEALEAGKPNAAVIEVLIQVK